MQVDPIKPTLTAPGTRRFQLKCDEPLSKIAFNFRLRRYTKCGAGPGDLILFSAGDQAGAHSRPLFGST